MRRSAATVPGVLVALLVVLFGASCGSTAENDQRSTDSAPQTENSASTGNGASTGNSASAPEPDPNADSGDSEELFPDVVEVEAVQADDGTWTFSVTLSSPYDTPERYADAWRVAGPDGEVFGIRELTHDHQSEQPFTRSQAGIVIPDEVQTVVVEGRDQLSGWGGTTLDFTLER